MVRWVNAPFVLITCPVPVPLKTTWDIPGVKLPVPLRIQLPLRVMSDRLATLSLAFSVPWMRRPPVPIERGYPFVASVSPVPTVSVSVRREPDCVSVWGFFSMNSSPIFQPVSSSNVPFPSKVMRASDGDFVNAAPATICMPPPTLIVFVRCMNVPRSMRSVPPLKAPPRLVTVIPVPLPSKVTRFEPLKLPSAAEAFHDPDNVTAPVPIVNDPSITIPLPTLSLSPVSLNVVPVHTRSENPLCVRTVFATTENTSEIPLSSALSAVSRCEASTAYPPLRLRTIRRFWYTLMPVIVEPLPSVTVTPVEVPLSRKSVMTLPPVMTAPERVNWPPASVRAVSTSVPLSANFTVLLPMTLVPLLWYTVPTIFGVKFQLRLFPESLH